MRTCSKTIGQDQIGTGIHISWQFPAHHRVAAGSMTPDIRRLSALSGVKRCPMRHRKPGPSLRQSYLLLFPCFYQLSRLIPKVENICNTDERYLAARLHQNSFGNAILLPRCFSCNATHPDSKVIITGIIYDIGYIQLKSSLLTLK